MNGLPAPAPPDLGDGHRNVREQCAHRMRAAWERRVLRERGRPARLAGHSPPRRPSLPHRTFPPGSRHSRASGNPQGKMRARHPRSQGARRSREAWIPACAGMTAEEDVGASHASWERGRLAHWRKAASWERGRLARKRGPEVRRRKPPKGKASHVKISGRDARVLSGRAVPRFRTDPWFRPWRVGS